MVAKRPPSMSPATRHYYVDEGGDSTLFSGKGSVLIGGEGCSRFFILGMLDVQDPVALQRDIDILRAQLTISPGRCSGSMSGARIAT